MISQFNYTINVLIGLPGIALRQRHSIERYVMHPIFVHVAFEFHTVHGPFHGVDGFTVRIVWQHLKPI